MVGKKLVIIIAVIVALGLIMGGTLTGFFLGGSDNQFETLDIGIDNNAILGNENAPITIVEFSGFLCGYCAELYGTDVSPQFHISEEKVIQNIKKNYVDTGKARLVFRQYSNPSSVAANAAECAGEQGKFWEYHDKLFENRFEWISENTIDELEKYASELNLDTDQFNSCLESEKYSSEIQKDLNDGKDYGVGGTPTLFIIGPKSEITREEMSILEQLDGMLSDSFVIYQDSSGNYVIKIVGAGSYSIYEQVLDAFS